LEKLIDGFEPELVAGELLGLENTKLLVSTIMEAFKSVC